MEPRTPEKAKIVPVLPVFEEPERLFKERPAVNRAEGQASCTQPVEEPGIILDPRLGERLDPLLQSLVPSLIRERSGSGEDHPGHPLGFPGLAIKRERLLS
jgi:hypothetical protein